MSDQAQRDRSARRGAIPRAAPTATRPHLFALKRAAMAAGAAFIAINIWTGAPLLALWIGSQVVGHTALSMAAVFVVVLSLALLVVPMVLALSWLNTSYNALTGQPQGERRLRWLHSMSTQGANRGADEPGLSALERIVMTTVYVAVIALLVWFFVFARSPLPG
jgi:hypothetical protein